jgi:hypothetical protein
VEDGFCVLEAEMAIKDLRTTGEQPKNGTEQGKRTPLSARLGFYQKRVRSLERES